MNIHKQRYKTEQESFWAGDFGTEYIRRNQGDAMIASNLNFFVRALSSTQGIKSCVEFGANIGLNLAAIKLLYPNIELHGIEINADAIAGLKNVIPPKHVFHESILDFEITRHWDLALVKGVLIHINPDELSLVYEKLVTATCKYLLVAEYYNPTPVAIPYRGHADRLYKRDFAGEILDSHPEMRLIDYGFAYRRDTKFPQDDMTWFLLEKVRN